MVKSMVVGRLANLISRRFHAKFAKFHAKFAKSFSKIFAASTDSSTGEKRMVMSMVGNW